MWGLNVHTLSHAYQLLCWLRKSFLGTRSVIKFYLFAEIGFYIYYRMQKRNLQWHYHTKPLLTMRQRSTVFNRISSTLLALGSQDPTRRRSDFERFIRGWFLDAEFDRIKRDNVLSFLSWAMFNSYPVLLDQHQTSELHSMLHVLEDYSEHRFPPGRNDQITGIRLTLDPMPAMHRPLFVYLFVGFANIFSRFVLQLRGFQRYELGGFCYWYRPAPSGATVQRPVVFMHGLGQGLLSYIHFLRRIDDRALFLMEFPYVSMRVWEHIPSPQETVDAVAVMLDHHNYTQATFLGHSFGTFCVAWCIKLRPSMVHSAIVIDPVCRLICCFTPHALRLGGALTVFLYPRVLMRALVSTPPSRRNVACAVSGLTYALHAHHRQGLHVR